MPITIVERCYAKRAELQTSLKNALDAVRGAAELEALDNAGKTAIKAKDTEKYGAIWAWGVASDAQKAAGRMAESLLLKSLVNCNDEDYLDYLERVRRRWEAAVSGLAVGVEDTKASVDSLKEHALFLFAMMPKDATLRRRILRNQRDQIGNLDDFREEAKHSRLKGLKR